MLLDPRFLDLPPSRARESNEFNPFDYSLFVDDTTIPVVSFSRNIAIDVFFSSSISFR